MRYIIANTEKAMKAGIYKIGHLIKNDYIIINEKEVTNNSILKGEFESRVNELGGSIHTNTDINYKINEGGWNYGL